LPDRPDGHPIGAVDTAGAATAVVSDAWLHLAATAPATTAPGSSPGDTTICAA